MTLIQTAFAIMVLLAIVAGRPPVRVAVAIAGNLIASIVLYRAGVPANENVIWSGIIDTCTVAALLGANSRANVAAVCYAAMVVIYPMGYWFAWGLDATYTCIEALGVLALGAIGGLDRPLRRLNRAFRAVTGRRDPAYHRNSGGVAGRVTVALVSQTCGR